MSTRLQDAYAYAQTVDYEAASEGGSAGAAVMRVLNGVSFGWIPDSSYVGTV